MKRIIKGVEYTVDNMSITLLNGDGVHSANTRMNVSSPDVNAEYILTQPIALMLNNPDMIRDTLNKSLIGIKWKKNILDTEKTMDIIKLRAIEKFNSKPQHERTVKERDEIVSAIKNLKNNAHDQDEFLNIISQKANLFGLKKNETDSLLSLSNYVVGNANQLGLQGNEIQEFISSISLDFSSLLDKPLIDALNKIIKDIVEPNQPTVVSDLNDDDFFAKDYEKTQQAQAPDAKEDWSDPEDTPVAKAPEIDYSDPDFNF